MCITSPAHINKKTTTKKHSLSVLQLRWEFAWSSNSCVVFSGQWRSNPFVNIIRDFLWICSSFQSFLSIGEQTRFRVIYSHSYWIHKPSQIINFGSRVFFQRRSLLPEQRGQGITCVSLPVPPSGTGKEQNSSASQRSMTSSGCQLWCHIKWRTRQWQLSWSNHLMAANPLPSSHYSSSPTAEPAVNV